MKFRKFGVDFHLPAALAVPKYYDPTIDTPSNRGNKSFAIVSLCIYVRNPEVALSLLYIGMLMHEARDCTYKY